MSSTRLSCKHGEPDEKLRLTVFLQPVARKAEEPGKQTLVLRIIPTTLFRCWFFGGSFVYSPSIEHVLHAGHHSGHIQRPSELTFGTFVCLTLWGLQPEPVALGAPPPPAGNPAPHMQ